MALTALGFSAVCFISFVFGYAGALGGNGSDAPQRPLAQGAGVPVTAADLALVLEALAKLGDTLIKAGPALWRLLASVLFLLIAALSAGVFQGSPKVDRPDVTSKSSPDTKQNLDVGAMRGRPGPATSPEPDARKAKPEAGAGAGG